MDKPVELHLAINPITGKVNVLILSVKDTCENAIRKIAERKKKEAKKLKFWKCESCGICMEEWHKKRHLKLCGEFDDDDLFDD